MNRNRVSWYVVRFCLFEMGVKGRTSRLTARKLSAAIVGAKASIAKMRFFLDSMVGWVGLGCRCEIADCRIANCEKKRFNEELQIGWAPLTSVESGPSPRKLIKEEDQSQICSHRVRLATQKVIVSVKHLSMSFPIAIVRARPPLLECSTIMWKVERPRTWA